MSAQFNSFLCFLAKQKAVNKENTENRYILFTYFYIYYINECGPYRPLPKHTYKITTLFICAIHSVLSRPRVYMAARATDVRTVKPMTKYPER